MNIKKMKVSCNLETVRDGRGGILTFLPEVPILEYNLIFTKAGKTRGFHYHPEFHEFILVSEGHGVYAERDIESEELVGMVKVSAGDSISIPPNTPHELYAITDMRLIALLSKPWDECTKAKVDLT